MPLLSSTIMQKFEMILGVDLKKAKNLKKLTFHPLSSGFKNFSEKRSGSNDGPYCSHTHVKNWEDP